jgi:hypothetical protein
MAKLGDVLKKKKIGITTSLADGATAMEPRRQSATKPAGLGGEGGILKAPSLRMAKLGDFTLREQRT